MMARDRRARAYCVPAFLCYQVAVTDSSCAIKDDDRSGILARRWRIDELELSSEEYNHFLQIIGKHLLPLAQIRVNSWSSQ